MPIYSSSFGAFSSSFGDGDKAPSSCSAPSFLGELGGVISRWLFFVGSMAPDPYSVGSVSILESKSELSAAKGSSLGSCWFMAGREFIIGMLLLEDAMESIRCVWILP